MRRYTTVIIPALVLFIVLSAQSSSILAFGANPGVEKAREQRSRLTEENAKIEAKKHMQVYGAFCTLSGEGGVSVANEFLQLFSMNAYIPDDITKGESVSPNQYVGLYQKYFYEEQVRIKITSREDQIEARFIEVKDVYEVVVPFQKTLSHKVENGRVIKVEQSFWMKAIIHVDRNLTATFTGIQIFTPSTGSELTLGVYGAAGFGAELMDAQFFSQEPNVNTLAWDAGLRARFLFNPFSPANFTQRKNIRFYAGLDIGFTSFNAKIDGVYQDSLYRNDLYEGRGGDQSLSGWVTTRAEDVQEKWQILHLTGSAGLNFQLYSTARRKAHLNIGAAYSLPVSVNFSQTATCYESWTIEQGQFEGNGIAHTYDGDAPLLFSNSTNGFQCNTTEWSKEDSEVLNPQLAIDINPTFQFKPGTSSRMFEAGLMIRVPMQGWNGVTEPTSAVIDEIEGSILREYSNSIRFMWFGISFAVLL